MKLNEVRDNDGAHVGRTRRGRGIGSGKGKTSGHGHKGQKSRSGVSLRGFEGGQMPLYRRLPKRGFNNIFRQRYAEVNLSALQQAIDDGKLDASKPITEAIFCEAGLMRKSFDGVRILGQGGLKAKVTLEVAGASKSAVAAIEKAGGAITLTAPVKDKEAKRLKRSSKSKKKKSAPAEEKSPQKSAKEKAPVAEEKPAEDA
jgi:large subunit ribosomal protein L15